METWIWISLWIAQTIVGTILWRKYIYDKKETVTEVLLQNALVVVNIFFIVVIFFKSLGYLYKQFCYSIDFLAGVKNKTEEE